MGIIITTEKMKDDFETFCCSAQRFMDSVNGQQEIKTDTPDYTSWIGKVVYRLVS